jgi:copper chaperone CopZ
MSKSIRRHRVAILGSVAMVTLSAIARGQIENVAIRAKDITCEGCAFSIKAGLKKVEGIKSTSVDVKARTVRIEPEKGKIPSVPQIREMLDRIGFTPEETTIEMTGKVTTLATTQNGSNASESRRLEALLRAGQRSGVEALRKPVPTALLLRLDRPLAFVFLLPLPKKDSNAPYTATRAMVGKTVALTGIVPPEPPAAEPKPDGKDVAAGFVAVYVTRAAAAQER